MSNTTTATRRNAQQTQALPPYLRAEEALRARIQEEGWPVGTKLPNRKELAQEYGVALATMERAMASLLADGTLRADGARGTFVADTSGLAARARGAMEAVLGGEAARTSAPGRAGTTALLGVIGTYSPAEHSATDNFWIRTATNSLEQVFSAAGGATHFFNRYRRDRPPVRMREAVESLLTEGVGALAVMFVDDPGEVEEIAATVADRVPAVFVTSGEIRRPLLHVFYDNADAGYQAAKHLLRQGHRRVAFLAPFETAWAAARVTGARAAILEAGLPPAALAVHPARQVPSPLRAPDQLWPDHRHALEEYQRLGFSAAHRLLEDIPGASAVIAADDFLAMGLLRVAQEESSRVKQGPPFAVVGFDDNPESRLVGLTTLRPPLEALGREAARLLLLALEGERTVLQVRLRSHLVPRLSTRVPRARSAGGGP